MATRKATGLLERSAGLSEGFWYSTKRRPLGPPLVNQDLGEQRPSKPLALGMLSLDGISSSALFYGRSHIPGIVCGARVRFRGSAGIKNGRPVMINPAYELLFPAV